MNTELRVQIQGACDTLTNIPALHTGVHSFVDERFALKYAVHYRVHSSLPLNPEMSQMNPVHILTLHFLMIQIDDIPPSLPPSLALFAVQGRSYSAPQWSH
jgi:hypothetical protein